MAGFPHSAYVTRRGGGTGVPVAPLVTVDIRDWGENTGTGGDDTTAFQDTVNFLCGLTVNSDRGGEMVLPPGVFGISDIITPPHPSGQMGPPCDSRQWLHLLRSAKQSGRYDYKLVSNR